MQRIAVKCGRLYRSVPRPVNSCVHNYNKSVPYLQYSSTASSIGSKTVSNNRDDKVIERTILRRNGIQSSETKNSNKIECIESIKFFADEHIIQTNFSDGQSLNFNTFWLRDSCLCQLCVHPLTKTKLRDSADISADLFADRIHFSGDVIEIQWRSGPNDEHISHYSADWLKLFSHVFDANPERENSSDFALRLPNDGLYASRVPKPETFLWDSTQVDKQKMTISYNHFMESDKELTKFLDLFYRFGVAFLEDVPIEKNRILSVARRMAYERQTSYGKTFDVIFKPELDTHIAYSGALLEAHVDLPYRERSPGVQLLHCLEAAQVGGASTLVDGFKCAETLRHTNPQLFQVLTQNAVPFSFCDKEKGIWFREKWPIIGLNSDQSVKEIHYSYISMRPPLLPSKLMDTFYEAYRSDP